MPLSREPAHEHSFLNPDNLAQMPGITADIENSVREALVRAILSNPKATIADLLELTRGEHASMLREITLGQLADAAGGKSNKRGKAKAKGQNAPKPAHGKPEKVNTRTQAGREAYDKAILEALKELGGGPVSGAKIKARVGGTPLQARTALNRLIETGAVTFEGKARGTKYSLK